MAVNFKENSKRGFQNYPENYSGRGLLVALSLTAFMSAGQPMPACAQDSQQMAPAGQQRLLPGQRFAQRRRQMRMQRQMQKQQNFGQNPSAAPLDNSIGKSQDSSIDVISGEDLKKGSNSTNSTNFTNSTNSTNSANSTSSTNSTTTIDLKNTAVVSPDNSQSDKEKPDTEKASKEKSNKDKSGGEAPCLSWLNPLGKPKAVILCVHGLGLHSGSYEQFGKAMATRGYAVYAVDVRGFGSWMAAKGREKCDFKHCTDDIVSTLNVLRMANPGVPVFLLGESMGGAIAMDVAAEQPELINGLISAVPAADRFQSKRTDLKVFLHLLTGNRKVNVEKSVVDKATADPTLREEWTGDPLGRTELSARELVQFQGFMNDNHDRAKKIDRLPVLIVQGGKDKLVKAEGTKELFEELTTPDKNLAMVNGAEHLVYEEGQFSNEVLDLTDNWIKQRLPNKDETAASPNLMNARAMMQSKQFVRAIPMLLQVTRQEPQNPEPFVLLGLAQMRTGHPIKARENVRKAFMIARASKDPAKANRANELLLNLPPQMVAPFLARQAGMPAGSGGQRLPGGAAMQGTYKVLIFSAKWCEPCKDLDPIINEAKARFGKRVEFTVLDVEDESNQPLVEKYHVSPIPTMIFLRPNGDVADYSVGFSGVSGMIKGIAKMLLPG